MPITLKLGELIAARPALERLVKTELPIMAAFKIGVRIKRIADELDTYDKLKSDLIVKLGTRDKENPQKWSIVTTDPNWAEYAAKVSELENQDVTIAAEPIKLAEFGDKPVISIDDIVKLKSFIVE